MSGPRFRIAPEIVHEEVDGEVIAIDLGSGSYFSIAGSGLAIWGMLGAGASEAEVGEALAGRYGVEAADVAGEVASFLAELEQSGLAVRDGGSNGASGPAPVPEAGGGSYEAPRFERYTDMKDYFLLDPIHEVDAAGWPKPAA